MRELKYFLLIISVASTHLPLYAETHTKQELLPRDGFASAECAKREKFSSYEKSDPAFYGLMAYLCDWKLSLLSLNIRSYRSLWSKLATGQDDSLYDITQYSELVKAKETYDSLSQKKDEYSLPLLNFAPNDLISHMIENNKINLLKKEHLHFYLKVTDCHLVDADLDTFSGNGFAQLYEFNPKGDAIALSGNVDAILERVFILEQKFRAQKSTASTKRCTKEFTESPLVLFSETIAPRLAEEMNTNPKSPAAKQLANALRKVQLHVMKVKNPELAAKIGSSLSQAINEIEKRHSVK